MSTLLLTMTLDPARADEVDRHVRTDVVPYVRRMPGFQHGRWSRSIDGRVLVAMVDFETDEQAEALAAICGGQGTNPVRSWNFEEIALGVDITLVGSPPDYAPSATGSG